MTLDQYRRAHRLSFRQLAQKLGIAGEHGGKTVQRYAAFKRIPDLAMIRRIHDATNGDVTWSDFPDRSLSARGAVEDVKEESA